MTPLTIAPPPAALVFDQMASEYDEVFTNSMIGRAQREPVWNKLTQIFQSGDHILELNCGTGEDALFLARNGMSVTACDASQQMINIANSRLHAEATGAQIVFNILPTERLPELQSAPVFDGAFSNFSGLNCVADLQQTAEDLATLLFPGAALLVCLSARFCLWEMFWFVLHGNFRKAFRRCSGHATAKAGDFTIDVYYPTVAELEALFSPFFVLRSCTGIGVTVPPSYVETWIRKHPNLLKMLCTIDKTISGYPVFRMLGDHVLLHFERVQA